VTAPDGPSVCPACEGDGWGWVVSGGVVAGTEASCSACAGSGRVERDRLPRALRLRRSMERAGLV
jgi:hypothetical protein